MSEYSGDIYGLRSDMTDVKELLIELTEAQTIRKPSPVLEQVKLLVEIADSLKLVLMLLNKIYEQQLNKK